MNAVSWLIYLAGLSGALQVTLTVLLVAMVSIVAIMAIGTGARIDNAYDPEDKEEARKGWVVVKRAFKRVVIIVPIFALILALIPSRQTVLLIAASELGEEVIANPEVVETATSLMDYIQRQLTKLVTEEVEEAP